ncbi:MAG: CotS family spore coat protein [Clostridiaceae bacterium]
MTKSDSIFSEENIQTNVLPLFHLDNSEVTQVKFKNTIKQRAVYKINNSGKYYCLKKVYFNKEELLFIYSALEWLYRCNILVPKFLPSKNGLRYAEYNDMLFILTYWVDGEKCDYDNLNHVIKSIDNLGKMHRVSKDFIPISESKLLENHDSLYKSMTKHFFNLLESYNQAQYYKDKYSEFFLDNFEKNLFLAKSSMNISSSINNLNLTRSLCHLDYVNKNIIIDNNNKVNVIDFDKCRLDFVAHDLSYFFRRFLKRNGTNWNLEFTINLLNTYEKQNSLNIDDYKYILSYLSFPQKYWKLSKDYYNNIKRCNKYSFFNLLKASVKRDDLQILFVKGFKDHIETKFNEKI